MLADEAEHGKMADVVLVYRSDFQKQDEKIEMLTGDLATLQGALSSQVEEIRKECDERTSMARRVDQDEIAELRRRYDALMQASQAKEREHLRIIKALEASHCQAAEQLEGLYEKKIAHDADKYNDLQSDRRRLEDSIEQMRGDMNREFDAEKKKMQWEWQKQMDDKALEIAKLQDRMAYLEHRYEAMLAMEENDHELEMDKRRIEFESEIKTQRQKETMMKKQEDSLLRGLDMCMKDKDKVAKEKAENAQEIARLTSQCDELKRQVSGLQKERKEQEKNSTQQEKRITDYKQKVSTLKKFKHVLDFRLREVSESLMPKERQIEQLKAQLQDTEAEFEKQLNTQQHLQQTMELRNQKIAQLQEEVKKQESSVKEKVKRLYHKYVKKERTTAKSDTRGVEEITKQMGLMEKKITSFAVKSERAELACKTDTQRKALENSLLIHELNELRYEKKNLESKLRNYELQAKSQSNQADRPTVKPPSRGALEDEKPVAGSAVEVARKPSQ